MNRNRKKNLLKLRIKDKYVVFLEKKNKKLFFSFFTFVHVKNNDKKKKEIIF